MKTAVASKTIWLNVVSVAVAVLMFTGTLPMISGDLKDLILAVVGILNVILRWQGNSPIKGVA